MTRYVRYITDGTETWYQMLKGSKGLMVYSNRTPDMVGREFNSLCGANEPDAYHSIRDEFDESELPDEICVELAKRALLVGEDVP